MRITEDERVLIGRFTNFKCFLLLLFFTIAGIGLLRISFKEDMSFALLINSTKRLDPRAGNLGMRTSYRPIGWCHFLFFILVI